MKTTGTCKGDMSTDYLAASELGLSGIVIIALDLDLEGSRFAKRTCLTKHRPIVLAGQAAASCEK